MIEIKQVKTKRQMRKFVSFPLELYKDNKFYVPWFFGDELKLINKNNVYSDYTDSYFYLAFKDGEIAGRICAMVNYASIEKTGEKNLRFTRFDVIDDFEVAKALFEKVEELARSLGFGAVHGPWGYNDLDKEGMLVKGFDYLSTYGGTYNFEYYPKFLEKLGYIKETEWLERYLHIGYIDEKMKEVNKLLFKRYGFREITDENKKMPKIIDEYGDKIFELLDVCYRNLPGVVPLTERFKKFIVTQLKLILNPRYISIVADKDDNVVGVGIAVRSFARALNKSKGKLLPFGLFRILHDLKNSKELELLLVGVHPDYQNKGLVSMVFSKIQGSMNKDDIWYAETNHTLEDNYPMNNMWETYFEHIQHKRLRCYIKKL